MAMSRTTKQDDLQRGLECSVCHEQYRNPKILPCGHSLCLDPCLEQIADGKSRMGCPECRTQLVVPEGGVKKFPTNITVSRMVEKYEPSAKYVGCPICGEIEDLTKCLHCSLIICELCRMNHTTKFKEHIKELLTTMKEKTLPAGIALSSRQKEEALVNLAKNVGSTITKIKTFATQVHTAIDDQVQDMIKQVESFHQEEISNIEQFDEAVRENIDNVADFCNSSLDELTKKSFSQSKLAGLMSSFKGKRNLVVEEKGRGLHVQREVSVLLRDAYMTSVQESCGEIRVMPILLKMSDNTPCSEYDSDLEDYSKVLERDMSSVKLCVGSPGSGDGNLQNPFGVAINPKSEDIIVVDYANHRVQIFDKNGNFKLKFGSTGNGQNKFQLPIGVAITLSGHIIISDNFNNCIKVYTEDGKFVRMFGTQGSKPGEINNPLGVAVDKSEDIHVCDNLNKRIQVFDSSGRYKYQYNSWTVARDEKPRCISINGRGSIVVILTNGFAVLNEKLQLLNTFESNDKYGVYWIDDELFVTADKANDVAEIYNISGELVKQFGTSGYNVGQLKSPKGVTVDGHGFVYVSSSENHMVQKF